MFFFTGIDLSGATITHNHPSSNGITSFGKDDFTFLQDHQDVRRLIAINEKYTYSVHVLKDISNLSYTEYYRKALEEVDLHNNEIDMQHKVFEVLNREGFVKYVREKIN